MNQHNILIKVYANIYPAGQELYNALINELSGLYIEDELEGNIVDLKNDLILISFEGIHFPIEEIIETIEAFLSPTSQGKVDYIDLENWRLTRYIIKGKHISHRSNSLNAIMEYSQNK